MAVANCLSKPTSYSSCSQLFTWVTVKSLSTAVASEEQTAAFRCGEGGSSRKPSSTHHALIIKRSACPRHERGHGDRYPYHRRLRLQSGYKCVKRKENFEYRVVSWTGFEPSFRLPVMFLETGLPAYDVPGNSEDEGA